MFVGISCCLQAQPGPYTRCTLFFTTTGGPVRGTELALTFSTLRRVKTSKKSAFWGLDQTKYYGLLIQMNDLDSDLGIQTPNRYHKGHTFHVEWNKKRETSIDVFLFPIPPKQRFKKEILINAFYVTHVQMMIPETNKQGYSHNDYIFTVPLQRGKYVVDFFDLDIPPEQLSRITKYWKPQKHPTKMYTFRVR